MQADVIIITSINNITLMYEYLSVTHIREVEGPLSTTTQNLKGNISEYHWS